MPKTWFLPSNEHKVLTRRRLLAAWLSVWLWLAVFSNQDKDETPASVPVDQVKVDQAKTETPGKDLKNTQSKNQPAIDARGKSAAQSKPAQRQDSLPADSSGTSKKLLAKELRRPTTPTKASAVEDRPPRPKFARSIKDNQSNSYDLTFDDLAFEIKEGETFRWSMITPEIQSYNGSKITLRGYIRPSFKQRGLEQFIFVRDNQECCFGPGAALFDCVLVKMAAGKGVDYTVRPVTLEGEFYLRKYTGPDGNVWAIFRMKEVRLK